MTDNRASGLALIAGSAALIITMAFHPTGHQVMHEMTSPDRFAIIARLSIAVHALALAAMVVLFLGACGLWLRLSPSRCLALAGLVSYGFAMVAGMVTGTLNGFVAPRLMQRMMNHSEAKQAWDTALTYSADVAGALASVLVVTSSVAILLWSIAIVRRGLLARGLGIYGCIIGPLIAVAVLSGHIRLNVHGFGLVVLLQSAWFVIAGVQLLRLREE
ncbi:MAG TPA: hypothetical protein VF493_00080 [Terriglobales bacterium]